MLKALLSLWKNERNPSQAAAPRHTPPPAPPPAPAAAPAPAPSPAPKAAVPPAVPHLPPSLDKHKPLVSAVAPVQAAAFWDASLAFLDIGALAAIGDKVIDPVERIELAAVADKGADSDILNEEGTAPVHVVLALWSLDRHGRYDDKGVRFPLGVLQAKRDATGMLFPDLSMPPRVNEDYLEPGVKARDISIGERQRADELLQEWVEDLTEDTTLVHGWRYVWTGFLELLLQVTGAPDAAALEARIAQLAKGSSQKNRKARHWKLCAAVYEAQESGAAEIRKLYASVRTGFDDHRQDLALFQQLCSPYASQYTEAIPAAANAMFLGHIDEYDNKHRLRPLFPLDKSQRTAVRGILALQPGQMQAVNGPPGSGKTSMLRAVVGSMWVHAALEGRPCPIIVACGATNQSVTNVIGAFGNAPHVDGKYHIAMRWLPGLVSYGAYLPSSAVKKDPGKQEDLKKLLCLQPARNGMLYEYWNRDEILKPANCLAYEGAYLQHAATAFPGAAPATLEQAVTMVWKRLHDCYEAGRAFQFPHGGAHDRLALAAQYLASEAAGFWHEDRLKQARMRIGALAANPADDVAAEEFMDLAWRAECFHLAARYWEGTFLLHQRERLLSNHPRNVEEALRRLCMLTPCLVSTLHMVPKLARIREEEDGHATKREFAFGLFDLLVVDEAGQSMPDLGAACFALSKRAAVVGDLKQLAPITQMTLWSETALARKAGFSEEELDGMVLAQRGPASGSVLGMARLVSRWREPDDAGISLRYHYRCVPNIVRFCKELCYPALEWCTKDEDEPQLPSMAWVEVNALPDRSGGSRRNIAEANEVVEWIVDQWPQWRVHPATSGKPIQDLVAIITPYAAQSAYFSEKLTKAIAQQRVQDPASWPSESDVKKIVIGTVHRLQGAERPFVCFSMVEGPDKNDGSSFIDRDPSMLNVGVSRAKKSFIVFGHPERLFHTADRKPPRETAGNGNGSTREYPSHALGRYLKSHGVRLYPQRLVIIEAAGKLKTLSRILGKQSAVFATKGALTTLPLHTGVDVARGMAPCTELRAGADETLERLARQVAAVDDIVIATDDDRMGEFIAWQVTHLLGARLQGKSVRRVRLGAMTRAAVAKAFDDGSGIRPATVVAEAVREVADCLISSRLASLTGQFAEPHPDEVARLRQIGALTGTSPFKARQVGRVQAAVLRMLLDRAREVADGYAERRIRVDAAYGASRVSGWLYHVEPDGSLKHTTTADKARETIALLARQGLQGSPRASPTHSPVSLGDAGTAAIMAQAWTRHRLAPWDTMRALQDLYDGSWHADAEVADPVEPIAAEHERGGHPPIRPLDARATPDAIGEKMPEPHRRVYGLIWDYWRASGLAGLSESALAVEYQFAGYRRAWVRFNALSVEGVPEDLAHIAFPRPGDRPAQPFRVLDAVAGALPAARLTLTDEAAVHWDYGPDALLWDMADARIGRPSTYASALESLAKGGLLALPEGGGALQLTPSGLATAILLETGHPRISAPAYSSELLEGIDAIADDRCGPREVLATLMRTLFPDEDHDPVMTPVWNSLEEMEAALVRHGPARAPAGPAIDGGSLRCEPDEPAGAP